MSQDLPPPATRNGAIAFKAGDGEWITSHPHDQLYSTVTMAATHVWRGGVWQLIDPAGVPVPDHQTPSAQPQPSDQGEKKSLPPMGGGKGGKQE